MRFWICGGLLALALVTVSLFFSKNGIRDWIRMETQMDRVRGDIGVAESSNQNLRKRLDLIDQQREISIENHIRAHLGWVRADERLYTEPTE